MTFIYQSLNKLMTIPNQIVALSYLNDFSIKAVNELKSLENPRKILSTRKFIRIYFGNCFV